MLHLRHPSLPEDVEEDDSLAREVTHHTHMDVTIIIKVGARSPNPTTISKPTDTGTRMLWNLYKALVCRTGNYGVLTR